MSVTTTNILGVENYGSSWCEKMELGEYSLDCQDRNFAEAPVSPVEELLFLLTSLKPRVISRILNRTRALKKFSYDMFDVFQRCDYEPKKLLCSLAKYTQSIEHITLEAYSNRNRNVREFQPHRRTKLEDQAIDPYGGKEVENRDIRLFDEAEIEEKSISLRGCKKLQSLRCHWDALYPESITKSPHTCQYHTEYDVRELLPETLESLHLLGEFSDNQWQQVCANFAHDSPLTPKLRNVFIEREDSHETAGSKPRKSIVSISKNPLARFGTRL
ncbi:unnamed protein product [Periconia digitata]|uniref:Uncharacterized protein n=1 Tax=Periconia digitata TaxID=1303443 RepID=A0A9W4U9P7_9PLEO|nr:unnamed protein product [Periconia digitata]